MRQLVNMRLPVELLARVDSVCGPRARTEFVVRALEAALDGLALKGAQGEDRGVSPGRLKSDSSTPAPPQVPQRPPHSRALGKGFVPSRPKSKK